MKTKRLRAAAVCIAVCAALTLPAALGVLRAPDRYLSDALYQRPAATDGNIVIIGFDRRALDAYGPFGTWSRQKVAETIELLNASPDGCPAVIGVDVLYDGESGDAAADRALVQAAGRCGNVLTGCSASFASALVETAGGFARDPFRMTDFAQPFRALREVTEQGHINTMLDSDGILRHHLLYLELPDGTRVPSLALALARRVRGDTALPPVDAHGFWYLSYSKKPGVFETISLADVLNGAVPARYFAGKIVLIGPAAPGLQDSYFTSMDHAAPMYGVEYQANAVQALLSGEFKREAGDGVQLAALFLVLAAAFAAFWQRRLRVSAPVWLALCGGWVLLCRAMYAAGWVLHVLWVPAGVTVLFVGCIAANYIRAALERRQIAWTFRRYVAPEIVSELLAAGPEALKPGGKKYDIAVLFVDIRGFTSLSERLPPERVVEILNRYLTLTTQCVMDHHGTLDKFVGDCTMAFWNAPFPQQDYVMLACRAAMDMVKGSGPLAEQLAREFGSTVSFGVGVHTGPAVVGNIGAPMRLDYTAIGDTVNTAARLEANAPANTVYISRAVADALRGRIRATPLASPPPLKGKTAGFEVLTLDEILETPD